MSDEDIKALVARMGKLTKVIAIEAVKGKPAEDQVSILDGLDFSQTEIATVTGMSQGNVSKTLKRLRAAAPQKKAEESDRK
jgi:DNA-binding MarR family transcriptional regulator